MPQNPINKAEILYDAAREAFRAEDSARPKIIERVLVAWEDFLKPENNPLESWQLLPEEKKTDFIYVLEVIYSLTAEHHKIYQFILPSNARLQPETEEKIVEQFIATAANIDCSILSLRRENVWVEDYLLSKKRPRLVSHWFSGIGETFIGIAQDSERLDCFLKQADFNFDDLLKLRVGGVPNLLCAAAGFGDIQALEGIKKIYLHVSERAWTEAFNERGLVEAYNYRRECRETFEEVTSPLFFAFRNVRPENAIWLLKESNVSSHCLDLIERELAPGNFIAPKTYHMQITEESYQQKCCLFYIVKALQSCDNFFSSADKLLKKARDINSEFFSSVMSQILVEDIFNSWLNSKMREKLHVFCEENGLNDLEIFIKAAKFYLTDGRDTEKALSIIDNIWHFTPDILSRADKFWQLMDDTHNPRVLADLGEFFFRKTKETQVDEEKSICRSLGMTFLNKAQGMAEGKLKGEIVSLGASLSGLFSPTRAPTENEARVVTAEERHAAEERHDALYPL